MNLSRLFPKSIALLLAACLLAGAAEAPSFAAKKKGSKVNAEEELKKGLDPISDQLTKLTIKVQSRALLSPNEAGQLIDIKYKLLDIVNQFPQNALLAKPLYQAGILFSGRESYNDAYELFSCIVQGFPATPYGAKAKGQMQQLEKRFGPDYFAVETAAPVAPAAETPATPAEKPSKK